MEKIAVTVDQDADVEAIKGQLHTIGLRKVYSMEGDGDGCTYITGEIAPGNRDAIKALPGVLAVQDNIGYLKAQPSVVAEA